MGTKSRILLVIAFFLTIFALVAFISHLYGIGIILISIVLALFLNHILKIQKILIVSIIWALDLVSLVILKSKITTENTNIEMGLSLIGVLTIPLLVYWIVIFIKNGNKHDEKNI